MIRKSLSALAIVVFLFLSFLSCELEDNSSLTFIITYHASDATSGEVPFDGKRYSPGDNVIVLDSTGNLFADEFKFRGWNTKIDGSGIFLSPGQSFLMPEENVSLFAQWELVVPTSFEGGDGSVENPYQIATPGQLFKIRESMDKHFILTDDIDLSKFNFGIGWEPIGVWYGQGYAENVGFNGSLNGNGKEIRNLIIRTETAKSIGLFGFTTTSAELRGLTLKHMDVSGVSNVGGLVGRNEGYVYDSSVSGSLSVSFENAGGMIGYSYTRNNLLDPKIYNNTSSVSVTGRRRIGGLIGCAYGTIVSCSSDGKIEGNGQYIGGLVGWNYGSIADSYSSSNVVNAAWGSHTGGLLGAHDAGAVTGSYSTGSVSGGKYTGGLIGSIYGGFHLSLSRCHASGDIKGANGTGGLIGVNIFDIHQCFSTGDVNGEDDTGGLIGYLVDGDITESYSESNVAGLINTGGLIGRAINSPIINNTYSRGNIIGTEKVGGLIGSIFSNKIYNNYSTGAVTGTLGVGGLVGQLNSTYFGETSSYYDADTSSKTVSAFGLPKTTAEMKNRTTFVGWDFDTVWDMEDGIKYPFLRWTEE